MIIVISILFTYLWVCWNCGSADSGYVLPGVGPLFGMATAEHANEEHTYQYRV
jgi:hypothetical protein